MAGILGLTNLTGFALYLFTSLFSALSVGLLKCNLQVGKYVPQAHTNPGRFGGPRDWRAWLTLTGLGQENLLGFLLFWIGSYALVHGEWIWSQGMIANIHSCDQYMIETLDDILSAMHRRYTPSLNELPRP